MLGRGILFPVCKVVGHAREKGLAGALPAEDVYGNEGADEAAAEGQALQPLILPAFKQAADLCDDRVAAILGVVVAVWPLWERLPRLTRDPPPIRIPRPQGIKPAVSHRWSFAWGHWQCLQWCAMALTKTSPSWAATCQGHNEFFRQVLGESRGHRLAACLVGDQSLLLCTACGAWASQRGRLLQQQCRRTPTPAGLSAIRRVEKGLHPDHKVQMLCGIVVLLSLDGLP